MDRLAPAPACRHSRICVETRRSTEFIDLTDGLGASVSDSGIRGGVVNVHTLHTITAILVNERVMKLGEIVRFELACQVRRVSTWLYFAVFVFFALHARRLEEAGYIECATNR